MGSTGQNPIDRDEMESLLAARQELGQTMEPALVDSFAQKIMAEVQRQSYMQNQQMQQQMQQQMRERPQTGSGGQLGLGIVSLVMAIPLTAITLDMNYPWMAVVVWVGIVLVNLAFTLRYRGPS